MHENTANYSATCRTQGLIQCLCGKSNSLHQLLKLLQIVIARYIHLFGSFHHGSNASGRKCPLLILSPHIPTFIIALLFLPICIPNERKSNNRRLLTIAKNVILLFWNKHSLFSHLWNGHITVRSEYNSSTFIAYIVCEKRHTYQNAWYSYLPLHL